MKKILNVIFLNAVAFSACAILHYFFRTVEMPEFLNGWFCGLTYYFIITIK